MTLKKKQEKTLRQIKTRPVLGTIPWDDIESLFVSLGATINERAGSRVAIVLNDKVHVFHRPHPNPDTDKGAVASVKRILMSEFPKLFEN